MNTPQLSSAPAARTDTSVLTRIILVLLGSALLIAVFEVVKQLVFPTITLWQSHVVTIAFGTLLATATSYAVSRRYQHLHQWVFEQMADRERAEEALRASEERYRSVVENALEAIVVVQDRVFKYANPQAEILSGYSAQELATQPFTDLIHPDDRQRVLERHMRRLAGDAQCVVYPIRIIDKAGNVRWVEIRATALSWQDRPATLNLLSDITERKRAEEKLLYLSRHDALTGLYNRTYFEAVLTQLSHSNPYPISVIMIDIDGMKHTNDTQGHSVGDERLRRIAEVLKSAFREGDIVARIGGDEFAVLLPHTNMDIAVSMLNCLRHKLAAHNSSYAGQSLSLSMGAATAFEHHLLAQTITDADQQMYRDKQEHGDPLAPPSQQRMNVDSR